MAGNSNSGGRNAKSPDQHKLTGTYRPDRHEGFENPDPPKGRPAAPKSLTGPAKAEWDRMVDRLEQSKTLATVDDAVLYQYVQLFAETEAIRTDNVKIRKLSDDLKKAARQLNGLELVEAIGKIVTLQHIIAKQVTQLRQGHMAIRQYLIEFGQTPAARSRVKVLNPGEKPKSKLFAFTGGKAATEQSQ